MWLDIFNTIVFLFGVCLFMASATTLWSNIKWAKANPLAVVIVAFLVDDLIDDGCVLAFSTHVFVRAITSESHEGINDVPPWLAVVLRLLLFGSSAVALLIARRQVAKDEERARQRQQEANALAERVAGSLRAGQ